MLSSRFASPILSLSPDMQDALKRLFDETAAWMSEANAVEEPPPASADASALQEELSALKEEYVRMAPCTEE